MKVLFEQNLVNVLRKLMNSSKRRVWIASPYIGNFSAVSRILGRKWQLSASISVRLLTDINECSNTSFETLYAFYKSGAVHSLFGLHAKIYIIDNNVIITSANLTETAFRKRYEMGVLLSGADAKEAISQYEQWWEKTSIPISLKKIKEVKHKCRSSSSSKNTSDALKNKWKLPAPQKEKKTSSTGQGTLQDFEYFLSCYKDFARLYTQGGRVDPQVPLYLEIDGFLDYLFHNESKPSSRYTRIKGQAPIPPRKVKNLKIDIVKHSKEYQSWLNNEGNDIYWRVKRSKLIQNKLSKTSIKRLNWGDLEKIADSLNCMNSLPINKAKFLNKKNNRLNNITSGLNDLIHGQDDIKLRLLHCKNKIKYFGDSSVQELIGFYFPNKYPIRNSNSNAGLRYFGYDVSV